MDTTETFFGEHPPRDGKSYDCQCARCGGSSGPPRRRRGAGDLGRLLISGRFRLFSSITIRENRNKNPKRFLVLGY